MLTETRAKAYFGGVAALVGAGLVLQVVLSATNEGGSFGSVPGRIFNFFCFFTVLSNIAVAVTHGMLARDPYRSSTAFRVARIVALLCIAVTGVVFHLALASLQELTGWDLLADTILHTLSPILAVAGNDYYPYPFLNAQELGYTTALLRCAVVAVFFLALAFGARAVDDHLPGLRREA